MVPNLGPNSSLGYTPFEYWKGPKPVLPRPKRNSRAVALDLEPLLPHPTPTSRPRASVTWPGQAFGGGQKLRLALPPSAFVTQPGTFIVSSNKGKPFAEILVVPPKVLVHPLFRDQIKTPDWPRGFSPYADSMNDSTYNMMGNYGYSDERLGQKPAWWDPRGWTKRVWAAVGAVIIVLTVISVVVVVTQNNQNR